MAIHAVRTYESTQRDVPLCFTSRCYNYIVQVLLTHLQHLFSLNPSVLVQTSIKPTLEIRRRAEERTWKGGAGGVV